MARHGPWASGLSNRQSLPVHRPPGGRRCHMARWVMAAPTRCRMPTRRGVMLGMGLAGCRRARCRASRCTRRRTTRTIIDLWPVGNYHPIRVTLKAGEYLIMRGDCGHRGVGMTKYNARAHFLIRMQDYISNGGTSFPFHP